MSEVKILREGSYDLIQNILDKTVIYGCKSFPVSATMFDAGVGSTNQIPKIRAKWLFDKFGWIEDLNSYDSLHRRLNEFMYYGDYLNTLRQRLNIIHLMMECKLDTHTPVHMSIMQHNEVQGRSILDFFDNKSMEKFSLIVHPGQTRAQASTFLNLPLKNVLLYVDKQNHRKFDIDPNTRKLLKRIETVEELMTYHSPNPIKKYKDITHYEYSFIDNNPPSEQEYPCKYHGFNNTYILKAQHVEAMSTKFEKPKKAPAHPSHWYCVNTFISSNKYFEILFENELNVYTCYPKEVETINYRNNNLLTQYFLGNEIERSETVLGTKSRAYRYMRSFEGFNEMKRNNFSLLHGSPDKNTLKEVFKLQNRSEEDIELIEKVYQNVLNYRPSSVTVKFNLIKSSRAIPDYYVKRNSYRGFCIVLNKYGTTRTFEELMFLAHPDFAISKTEDNSVMVINCSHSYWKDKKDYKEYIIPEEFLLYDDRFQNFL